MNDAEARHKIKRLFEDRHGETLYPSDVASILMLYYEQVKRLLDEMQVAGEIAEVTHA